jgi:hypothetical protein
MDPAPVVVKVPDAVPGSDQAMAPASDPDATTGLAVVDIKSAMALRRRD